MEGAFLNRKSIVDFSLFGRFVAGSFTSPLLNFLETVRNRNSYSMKIKYTNIYYSAFKVA